MTLLRALDAEQLLVAYLSAQADVATAATGGVHTELPRTDGLGPLVVLFRIGGASRADGWLDSPLVTIETWGDLGERRAVKALTETVRAALAHDQIAGSHALGVVTACTEVRGPLWLPDPPTSRPRFTFDIQLTTHPSPA